MLHPTDYRLIITDPALEDIEAIANFTTLQWGEQQAIVYKGVLAQALQQLQ
jgi:plasmid stabilization system protein ParE